MILRFVARRPRLLGAAEELSKAAMVGGTLVYFLTGLNALWGISVFAVAQVAAIVVTKWEPDLLQVILIRVQETQEQGRQWRARGEKGQLVYAAR